MRSTELKKPREEEEIVFQAQGLSKVYGMGERKVHALKEIDLDLYSGEWVVLLAASGPIASRRGMGRFFC